MAQILKANHSDNRGGKREGSGRKKLGNKIYSRKIKPEFFIKMDEFLNKLKNEKNNN